MVLSAFAPIATWPEATSETFVNQAVGIAAKLGARLHVSALVVDMPRVSNAFSRLVLDVPKMIRDAEAASRSRCESLTAAFEAAAAPAGVSLSSDTIVCQPVMAGERASVGARYHDLVMVGIDGGNQTTREIAETVVFGAGRPVLLLPETAAAPNLDSIAIAWDGSRVAARAVAAATALLADAKRIVVLTVLDEKPLEDRAIGERLAAALQARGLPAEALTIQAEDVPIGETLQRRAAEAGCGLLVMGGYGHSRLRDFVLGGATKGVLAEPHLPVLLSH